MILSLIYIRNYILYLNFIDLPPLAFVLLKLMGHKKGKKDGPPIIPITPKWGGGGYFDIFILFRLSVDSRRTIRSNFDSPGSYF